MTRIAVTGAAGNVGREALSGLSAYEPTVLTHREHPDLESTVFELTDYDSVERAIAGHDVVIHLAGNPSPAADWEGVSGPNIDGTYHVYEAARAHGVERVVFASTNHVTQYYNVSDPSRPESVVETPRAIRPDDPPRPDSYYAVSKLTGEALGSYYADRYDIEVVNFRIGWLLTEEDLEEKQREGDGLAHYARAMWLSPRDTRHAFRRAVEAELPTSPTTVNVLSRNRDRYLSLTETMCDLGYEPRDDSAEALDLL